ncbi:4'-phosphopantetheinyl transferase family protein [Priestia megaterium]|uniref:4'-phosphopantetheinyl transferase family protein n=1 Tax=Priestia megaterium TaxID=1404 RepID=UPI00203A5D29|nr:4'-phosphopantetheinyl transferase superfamily protein [Priestia megaterium]MCM3546819.1 4'-phosphopantetheinyl transferase superfamily protein [Priestia megaterium]
MDIFFFKLYKNERVPIPFLDTLSKRTTDRLDKINHHIRRLHIIYSEFLLNYVLYQQQKTKSPVEIIYNSQGKPFLEKGHYNISHSNEWIVCAYDDSGSIGIDIEEYKKIKSGLAKFFFTNNEFSHLTNLPSTEQMKFFIDTWTFKESYVKLKGISIFDIKGRVEAPRRRIHFLKEDVEINGNVFYYVHGSIENYSWCVITERDFSNCNIRIVSSEELFNTLKLF